MTRAKKESRATQSHDSQIKTYKVSIAQASLGCQRRSQNEEI
jgi:hypothetical protein